MFPVMFKFVKIHGNQMSVSMVIHDFKTEHHADEAIKKLGHHPDVEAIKLY